MKKLLATGRIEIGAAITDGCKAIHGKSSNEFIALIDRQPPKQKRVRVKTVGLDTRFAITWNLSVSRLI